MMLDLSVLYEGSFQSMPVGLFILDCEGKIVAWNDWMSIKTKVIQEKAVGQVFVDMFPGLRLGRFNWAFEQVIEMGAPQILSQILNQYLIPIPISQRDTYEELDFMQQHIEILPIKKEDRYFALVAIQDVTDNVHQKNVLMKMGHKLEDESLHDALTKIYNRRFLWEWLDKQLEQSKRSGDKIGCIMFDLDYFKKINDQYGHEAGDTVLQYFVAVVSKSIRMGDVFVRYGGEEFVVLMPRTDIASVYQQAERIRKAVEEESSNKEGVIKVTCSAGVMIWEPASDLSPQAFVNLADKALYLAKQNGRNRVCSNDLG